MLRMWIYKPLNVKACMLNFRMNILFSRHFNQATAFCCRRQTLEDAAYHGNRGCIANQKIPIGILIMYRRSDFHCYPQLLSDLCFSGPSGSGAIIAMVYKIDCYFFSYWIDCAVGIGAHDGFQFFRWMNPFALCFVKLGEMYL